MTAVPAPAAPRGDEARSPTAVSPRRRHTRGLPWQGGLLPLLAGTTAAVLTTADARATWSIVIADTRTGEIAAASATCLLGFDLRDNTPVILQGIGAATAQSAVDQTSQNRTRIRDGLADGVTLEDLLADLAQFDGGHQSRQYGIVTTTGDALTFSGANASAFAGGVTGSFGPLVYAIQGNILTGDPVVLEAEIAVLDALAQSEIDGTVDIPAAIMAGMEAARAFGGDGRCSCDLGPTDCGAPPPEPFVSAYIAYAIVARLGDTDVCNAAYPGPPNPSGVAVGDLNGDGLADAVLSSTSGFTGFGILLNATPEGAPPRFINAGSIVTNEQIRDVELADLDRDGRLDLIGPSDRTGGVVVAYATGPGAFAAPVSFGTGTPASNRGRTVAVGDFDGANGPDVAVTDGRADRIRVFLNDGTGALVEAAPVGLGFRYRDLRAADLTGDGLTDLAVASDVSNRVFIFAGDGAGAFTQELNLAVGGSPRSLVTGDFDGNGTIDLAVGGTGSPQITVIRRTGGGGFETSTADAGFAPDGLAAGDLNGDTIDDLLAFEDSGGGVARGLLGAANGTLTPGALAGTGTGAIEATLADLGNGGLDLVFASSGAGGLLVAQIAEDGTVLAGEGCGNGDYYLSLNISGGNPNAPDPVFQLQDLFEAEREQLRGVTDAVRTLVDAPAQFVTGTAGARVRVTPRDWGGHPATKVGTVTAQIASADEGVSGLVIGSEENGDGSWTVTVEADPASTGAVIVRLIAHDVFAPQPIALMPEVVLNFRPSAIDLDTNGRVDIFDLIEFLRRVQAQSPSADLNNDDAVDVLDILEFLMLFAAG